MAAEPQLVHVRTFCDLEKEAQHDVSLAVLRGELNAGPLTLVQLVCVMDEQLVSADNLTRARSVLLLSELLPAAELSPAHVSQLAIFFASKLADWPTLRGALGGCLHLLRTGADEEAARELGGALLQELQVPSLGAAERLLALQSLCELAQRHPAASRSLGARLLDGATAAVDGEKDPRCLAVAFALWHALGAAFPAAEQPMAGCAEALVDGVACYFPLAFSGGGRGGAGPAERARLADSLAQAMTASAAFAPFSMPLILGKLALPGDQGEVCVLDSLAALRRCLTAFPASALAPHAPAAWRALRGLILPTPPEAGAAPLSHACRLEAEAALTSLLRALGAQSGAASRELVVTALRDDFVLRSLQLLAGAVDGGAASEAERHRLNRALAALSKLLCAVAAASVGAARSVCAVALPPVFGPAGREAPPTRAAVRLAARLTEAAAHAAAHAAEAAGEGGSSLGSPLADAAPQLLHLFTTALSAEADEEGDGGEDEGEEAGACLARPFLGVAGCEALLSIPPACHALSESASAAAARGLTHATLAGEPTLQSFAAQALARLAGASALPVLCAHVLPSLLQEACGGECSQEALRALDALARAAPLQLGLPTCCRLAEAAQAELQAGTVSAQLPLWLHTLQSLLTLLGSDAAALAAPFVLCSLRIGAPPASLLRCVTAAAACCDATQQAELAGVARLELEARGPATAQAALSLVSALRPGEAVEALAPALPSLLAHALSGGAAGVPEALEASASLANKAREGEALCRAALQACGVLQGLTGENERLAIACCGVCGALSAGLAPRGAKLATELPAALQPLLSSASAPIAAAAALAFSAALVAEPLPHALAKPLWRQRCFTISLAKLAESRRSPGFFLALAHLLLAAPRAPLLQAAPALAPLLPECLSSLLGSVAEAALLSPTLSVVASLLVEPEGRIALAEHTGPLLRALVAVASAAAEPDARATALQALTAAAGLPYSKVFPHRRALLRDLAAATDDRRRAVRQCAVAARAVWASLPVA